VSISRLITDYGYFALFALVGAESLGVPLPGETALILAGAYAGSTHRMSPWAIFGVAAAAAIIGDNIGYWIGAKGGYRLARAHGRRIRLDERKLKIARYLFDRHGVKVVFFGRFVSILRTYAAFLAGTSKMRWRKFLPANAAGGIVWSAIYTTVSYFAGKALERDSGIIDVAIGILAAVVIVAALLLIRRNTGRLARRAEEAYPGPLELGSGGRDQEVLAGRHAQAVGPVREGASETTWRSVAEFASLVRYMLTPVEATTAGRPASNPAPASRSLQDRPARLEVHRHQPQPVGDAVAESGQAPASWVFLHTAPAGAAWIAERIAWLPVFAVTLAALWLVFRRAERAPRATPGPAVPAVSAAAAPPVAMSGPATLPRRRSRSI
jgi:membrane protein DedA with SNARE-associated domain